MKNKILTFGFDDCEIHDRKLCDIFRKYNLKATFFLISGQLSQKCDFHRYGEDTVVERVSPFELKETYKGMEVASHTENHNCQISNINQTVVKSCENLSKLCGYKVNGFAYPGGHYTLELAEELKKNGVLYARTVEETNNFKLPENLLTWHPTCKYDNENINKLAEDFLNYNGNEPALFYIYGHSYELTQKSEPYNWESFEKVLKKLSGKKDIWYATNKEVAEWLKCTE